MGYERELLESLLAVLKAEVWNLSGVQMLELGNQEVYGHYDKVEKLYAEYVYKHQINRRIVKPFLSILAFAPPKLIIMGSMGLSRLMFAMI